MRYNVFTYMPKKDIYQSYVAQNFDIKDYINIYVDLRNCLRLTFLEDTMANIYNRSRDTSINTDILTSIFDFITYLKIISHPYKTNFIIFWDRGKSLIHNLVNSDYKSNRSNSFKYITGAIYEGFMKVFYYNTDLFNKIGNAINNIYAIELREFESDFIPYHLIKTFNTKNNIIFSSDKDMHQILKFEKTAQYFKPTSSSKDRTDKFLDKNTYFEKYMKGLKYDINISPEFFDMMLSIEGDQGDFVKGVKGYGRKRAYNVLTESVINKYNKDEMITDFCFKEKSEDISKKYKNLLTGFKKHTSDEVYDILKRNLIQTSFDTLSQIISLPEDDIDEFSKIISDDQVDRYQLKNNILTNQKIITNIFNQKKIITNINELITVMNKQLNITDYEFEKLKVLFQ